MLKNNAKLEAFVLDIINRIQMGQHIEDSRVELKSTLIDPDKGARRIAGHANAASGQNIIWILGISEDGNVLGIENTELHEWFAKVKSSFDEVYPEFSELIISIEGKSVLAIEFKTERAPYVIKNPNYGKENSGPIEKEVPIREGTSIRSAKRSDLIKILSNEARSIDFETLDSYLYLTHNGNSNYTWNIFIDTYAYLIFNSQLPLTIPFHKINIEIYNKIGKETISGGWNIIGDIEKDSNISGGKTEFLLFGSSRIKLNATFSTDTSATAYINEQEFSVIFEPYIYEINRTIKLEFSLAKETDQKKVLYTNVQGRWILIK